MNIKTLTLRILTGLIPVVGMATEPVRFRAEFKPVGGLISPDIDEKGARVTVGAITYAETIDGEGSYYGTAQVGIEADAKICYIDVLAGGGLLANGVFAGGLFTGDVGCRFKLNEAGTLALGPYIGVVVPGDTELEVGDETLELSGSSGVQGGLKFTASWEFISFVFQAGYADFSYDAKPDDSTLAWEYTENDGDTWMPWAGDEELDMSGFFGQCGVSIQF